MNNSKKVLCFVLAAASVVPMMFAGCKTDGTSSTPTSSRALEPCTLTMWTGDKQIQGLDRVTAKVNEYLKTKLPGITIKWETMTWDDLGKKQTTALSTGQKIDIMNTSNWIGAQYVPNCTKNYFADISSYVTDPANKDLVDIIGKDFLDGTKVNGKYYGLPTNKEKAHNFGFLAQKKECDKLGITADKIKTADDMYAYFDQVKADGYIPLCAATMDNPFKFLDYDPAIGDGTPGAFDPADDCKEAVNQFTSDKAIAFYKQMKEFNTKGYFDKNASTAESQETEMGSGKYFCGTWSLKPYKNVEESGSLKLDLVQFDITPIEKTNRETTGALLAIPAASDNKEQAFAFMKLLYTDKTLINMMTYGIEGTDYTKLSDGTIEVAADTDFKSAGGWIMGNQFNNYLLKGQPSSTWQDYKSFNDKGKAIKSLGFIYDGKDTKTELAGCNKAVNDMYPQLFYGTSKDVDATVSQFKSKLEAAGVQKLLDDINKQYKKFLADNNK